MALSQNEIARITRVIALNGQDPIPQTILSAVGFTPEKLNQGLALVDAWDQARDDRDLQNDTRFALAKTKEQAQRQASLQIAMLRDFIDELWPDGSKKDNLLNRAFMVTDGSQRNSHKEADLMGDGKGLIRRIRRLDQEQRDLLAEYGWTDARLDLAWNLVDAFEDADRAHAKAVGQKEAKTEICVEAFKVMETWFRRLLRFVHRELMIQDPQNKLRIVQQLELPISHPSRRGARRTNTDPPTETPVETTEPEDSISQPEETPTDSEETGESSQSDEGESPEESKIDPETAGVEDIDEDFEIIAEEEPKEPVIPDEGGEPPNHGRG